MTRSRTAPALAIGLVLSSCTMFLVRADEADRIAELMNLEAGMRVAHVGARDGEWSEKLAQRVGESGQVSMNERRCVGIRFRRVAGELGKESPS